jgi:hypothetical protein
LLLLQHPLVALLNLAQVSLVLVLRQLGRRPNDAVRQVLVVTFVSDDNFVGLIFS